MAFPAVTTLGTGGVYGSGGVYGAPVVKTFGAPAITSVGGGVCAPAITSVGGGVYGAGGVIDAPVVETFGDALGQVLRRPRPLHQAPMRPPKNGPVGASY